MLFRSPNRFPLGKSHFDIPTFEEAIELIQGLNKTTGREAGLEPELKAPTFHAHEGLPVEAAFWEVCKKYGYDSADAKMWVQCFEPKPLKTLRQELGCPLRMLQLVASSKIQDALVTEKGLDEIATYANAVGPNKERITGNPEIVKWAHARGLDVHIYTLHADAIPKGYASFNEELEDIYVRCGVDGAFCDHPDLSSAFLDARGLR